MRRTQGWECFASTLAGHVRKLSKYKKDHLSGSQRNMFTDIIRGGNVTNSRRWASGCGCNRGLVNPELKTAALTQQASKERQEDETSGKCASGVQDKVP